MINEYIDSGPDRQESPWLYEKAMGHHYSLILRNGLDPHYRLTILDKQHTGVLHLSERFSTREEAMEWARAHFVKYLMEQRLLPKGGIIMEE